MALPFSGTPLFCPTGLREDEITLHKLKIREDALFLVCSKFNPATTESGDLFWAPWREWFTQSPLIPIGQFS